MKSFEPVANHEKKNSTIILAVRTSGADAINISGLLV